MTTTARTDLARMIDRLLDSEIADPHSFLGIHPEAGGAVVRAFHPAATEAVVVTAEAEIPMEMVDQRGLFSAALTGMVPYRLRFKSGDDEWEVDDPYRFLPTLGDLDLHLIGEGSHLELWRRLGARVMEHDGTRGTAFAVWAPAARGVRLVSDAGLWDNRIHFMRALGSSGVWEIFVPGVGHGAHYKFEIIQPGGRRVLKADPMARWQQIPPGTASIVAESGHQWSDDEWVAARTAAAPREEGPLSIYEVHLGSWRRGDEDRVLNYREVAEKLADYCVDMGFTHVELMPVAEHPFGGSWGYQVTSYYAPTSRHGAPDDFRFFVDHLHQRGIGVILDWVPAHFPRDDWALANFDGTALYEHADPRQGAHPDWGTLVFNYGRNEVRNFLVANARYWIEEFHVDGLRVDAVASMLYLDYSRKAGEWLPNRYGGRENLEAVALLREVNHVVHADYPGVMTVAEESTAWPGVSRPVETGGLGFSAKWNMGWMHDTLDYMAQDPVYRRYHHHKLTFGLIYAWSERFILPISHDEVVHGKGSLFGKMPGDRWRKYANLRTLLAWMWAHPGKQLLFMGSEIAQEREWSHDRSIDWHLLEDPSNSGVQRLVRDLNRAYRETAALWQRDFTPDGFRWIDAGNADQNIISFLRFDAEGTCGLACVVNFSPVTYHQYRVGLPLEGHWREVLNTDAEAYGGTNEGNFGGVTAYPIGAHGFPCSAEMTIPPMGALWLAPDVSSTEDQPSSRGRSTRRNNSSSDS
jgi:1,4-alpha-glucan branching enzyme